MEDISLGVGMFSAIILGLVAVLSFAKSKLVSATDVNILINGDPENTLKSESGTTLLNTLSAQKIFIPSACGGKGSCGVCKVNGHKTCRNKCNP